MAQAAALVLFAAPMTLLVGLGIRASRRRESKTLGVIALALVAAGLAVLFNYGLSHLYFRPRPYWVDPSVQSLLSRDGDTSFMPWMVIVAAATSIGVLALSVRWGLVSLAVTLAVMTGEVAVGANYPTDVLAAAAFGAAMTALLLVARHRAERVIGRATGWEVVEEKDRPAHPYRKWAVVGAVIVAAFTGYGVAKLEDHGTQVALSRAEGRLAERPPSDPRVYKEVSIDDLATGKVRSSHARVYGKVTYLHTEPDGDTHLEIRAPDDAFIVGEIPPEYPLSSVPKEDEEVTAWGIVRHDDLHNWWELHPLVGWDAGHLDLPSSPGLDD